MRRSLTRSGLECGQPSTSSGRWPLHDSGCPAPAPVWSALVCGRARTRAPASRPRRSGRCGSGSRRSNSRSPGCSSRAGEPAAGRAASQAPACAGSRLRPIPSAPRPELRPRASAARHSRTAARSPRPAPEAVRERRSSALEAEIGSRWMLIVGVVVLVLGVAFFVKYAFDRRWISETARIAGGTIAGIAVWLLGLRFVRRGYALFGRMIAGGGLAMMFVSAWAAAALYGAVTHGGRVRLARGGGLARRRHRGPPAVDGAGVSRRRVRVRRAVPAGLRGRSPSRPVRVSGDARGGDV